MNVDFEELTQYAKCFSGLSPDKEALLQKSQQDFLPHIPKVTDNFYQNLAKIPQAQIFLNHKVEQLKQTHIKWTQDLLTGPYDDGFTRSLYRIGEVHVRVNLPVEFMSGGITLIASELYELTARLYKDDSEKIIKLTQAFNSALGYSLFVMQKSYHASVGEALERFLEITGMSRALYEKLAGSFNPEPAL